MGCGDANPVVHGWGCLWADTLERFCFSEEYRDFCNGVAARNGLLVDATDKYDKFITKNGETIYMFKGWWVHKVKGGGDENEGGSNYIDGYSSAEVHNQSGCTLYQ
jgi:hypothetical protein